MLIIFNWHELLLVMFVIVTGENNYELNEQGERKYSKFIYMFKTWLTQQSVWLLFYVPSSRGNCR